MSDYAIQTHGLTCYFGAKRAVHALDLAVPKGSIFGFLGRNGSGKTTSIRMMLGLTEPTRGRATILGFDSRSIPPEARARIGYLTENHFVPGWMRADEAARFQASFYLNWNDDLFRSVLDHFNIDACARAKDMSRGERTGLALALTLAPDPELLILDDPALGLDPVVRRGLLESMLFVTKKEGRTILFSSHQLADVERVADNIAIIDRGELRACCSLDSLRTRVKQMVLVFKSTPPVLPTIPGLLSVTYNNYEVALTISNFNDTTSKILSTLPAERIEEVPSNLEDVFIRFVGGRNNPGSMHASQPHTFNGGKA